MPTKDLTTVRNRLEELNRLNQEYLETATTEADVHFYNAVQSIIHATALKLYGYTKDNKDYQIEADLHLLFAQLEHLRLLEAVATEKEPVKVVLVPQGPKIEYTDQRP